MASVALFACFLCPLWCLRGASVALFPFSPSCLSPLLALPLLPLRRHRKRPIMTNGPTPRACTHTAPETAPAAASHPPPWPPHLFPSSLPPPPPPLSCSPQGGRTRKRKSGIAALALGATALAVAASPRLLPSPPPASSGLLLQATPQSWVGRAPSHPHPPPPLLLLL